MMTCVERNIMMHRTDMNQLVLLLFMLLAIVSAAPYASPIIIAVTYPSALDVNRAAAPLELAKADLISQNLLTNISISFVYVNTGLQPVEAVGALLKATEDVAPNNIAAIVGDYRSNSTLALGYLSTSLSIPIINVWSSSALLSDRANCAYMTRMTINDAGTAAAITSVLKAYKWLRIAILYSDDDHGRGAMDQMTQNPYDPTNNDISVFSIPAVDSVTARNIINKNLEQIKALGIRIIILHSTLIIPVLDAALDAGLLSPPHVWIGTDWCTSDTIAALGSRANSLIGTICLVQSQPRTDEWNSFAARLSTSNTTLYPTSAAVPISAGNVYDGLFVLIKGLNALHSMSTSNTVTTLQNVMNNISFSGVTGAVSFPGSCSNYPTSCIGNTGDRFPMFDILNYNKDSNLFEVRGSYNNRTSELITANNSSASGFSLLVWSDGSTIIPKDRPDVYVVGDIDLPWSFDTRILVLAYVVSAFGCWTTLIIIEMAIFVKTKTIDSREWIAWIGLASIVLGIASSWAANYISLSSLTINTVSVYLQPLPMMASIPLVPIFVFMAFRVIMIDIRPRDPDAENSDTIDSSMKISSTHSATLRSRTAVSVSVSVVAQPVPRGWKAKIARRMSKGLKLPLLSGVFIMTVGVVLQNIVAVSSLAGPASLTVSVGLMVVAAIVILLGSIPVTFMFFYFNQNNMRVSAAFLMSAILWSSVLIGTSSFTTILDSDPSLFDGSNNIACDGTVTIILAASSLLLCVLGLSLNVFKLRLSRDALDRLSAQAQRQIDLIDRQIAQGMTKRYSLEQQLKWTKDSIELINLCRPIPRPYAMAIALAEPKCEGTIQEKVKLSATEIRTISRVSRESGARAVDTDERDDVLSPTGPVCDSPDAGFRTSLIGGKIGVTATRTMNRLKGTTTKGDFALIHRCKNNRDVLKLLDECDSFMGPGNAVKTGNLGLASFLAHPFTFELLKDTLARQFTSENLGMWAAIQRYRSVISPSIRLLTADEMIRLFVANGAVNEVNISSTMKDTISSRLVQSIEGKVKLSHRLFDEVEQEIHKLINTNNMEGLENSVAKKMARFVLNNEKNQQHVDNPNQQTSSTWAVLTPNVQNGATAAVDQTEPITKTSWAWQDTGIRKRTNTNTQLLNSDNDQLQSQGNKTSQSAESS